MHLMVVVVVVTEGLLLLEVFTVSTGASMAFIFVERDGAGLGGCCCTEFPSLGVRDRNPGVSTSRVGGGAMGA